MADGSPSNATLGHPRRGLRGSLSLRIGSRLLAYLLGCWGLAGVLAHGLFPHAELLIVAIAVYTTAPLAIFLRWRGFPFYPGAAFRLLVLRPFWYVELTLPLVTIGAAVGVVVGSLRGTPLVGGRVAAAGVLTIMSVCMVAGYLGSRRLNVQRLNASVVGLPSELDGLTIVQLTDLHVGPQTSHRFLRRVAEATMALSPDLIAVTGDLVDDRAEDVDVYVSALGQLRAPLGVFMIAGNHDVYAGWDAVRTRLEAANVGEVLVNESRVVSHGGVPLAIVGLGDPAGRSFGGGDVAPDIERAFATVPPDVPVLALAHNPALWPALAERQVALTLSGHTHWGQFAIRSLRWCLASPFLALSMGAYTKGDSMLYISPGTGYWGLPFRIGATAEVTAVTLRRATAGAALTG